MRAAGLRVETSGGLRQGWQTPYSWEDGQRRLYFDTHIASYGWRSFTRNLRNALNVTSLCVVSMVTY